MLELTEKQPPQNRQEALQFLAAIKFANNPKKIIWLAEFVDDDLFLECQEIICNHPYCIGDFVVKYKDKADIKKLQKIVSDYNCSYLVDFINIETADHDDIYSAALKDSYLALELSRIKGFDEKLQQSACLDPTYAYDFAKEISGANVNYCQKHACEEPDYAFYFAKDITGADIKYCQEHACKNPRTAWLFACQVVGADINYCLNAIIKSGSDEHVRNFADYVKNADLNKCMEAELEIIKKFYTQKIMEKACK